MTHTLHRLGSVESLKDDYIVLIMKTKQTGRKPVTAGLSSKSKTNKILKSVINRFLKRHPNIRSRIKEMRWNIARVPRFPGFVGEFEKSLLISALPNTTVFNNKADLFFFLKRLKKLDLGRSVVVSGLISEVHDSLKEIGMCPHSVEFSLGIFGNKSLLPQEELLQITTMCGHHLMSPRLVEKLYSDAKKGRLTYEEAAKRMAKLCFCGAFNIQRAVRLMKAAQIIKGEAQNGF